MGHCQPHPRGCRHLYFLNHVPMKKSIVILASVLSIIASAQSKKSKPTPAFSTKDRTITIVTTADSTQLKLTTTGTATFRELRQPVERQTCVFVQPQHQFQSFMGIGGAITDASAEVFAQLPKEKQNEFLTAYFSKTNGIGYSIIRTNMNSCDFSSDSYTYIQEGDAALKTFDITHDKKYKLPLIKQAMGMIGNQATFYISPWSPPAFMKDNKDMLHGGKLLPEFRQSWANYYVKYINALEKEGLPIWGLSIQNEPMATQIWESCLFSAEEERDFLKYYLGPTLQKAGLSSKKIIAWDHNRDLMVQRATTILDDPEAAKYVWGIGFHWYETWSGGQPMFDNVKAVHELYPHKNLIFTEGCKEKFDATKYQLWRNGEIYGESMINDFNNGTVAWTDWNILLDQFGGPNHAKNFCFAPVHADLSTNQIIYTPAYYIIGHFSKFIEKKARRVSSVASRSNLLTTSFLNPNGKMVTVVLNKSNQPVEYQLCIGTTAATIAIPAHAIQTLMY